MMTFSPPLPAVPTDNALTYAMTLLAVAADPAGTKARLDELACQITAVHAAVAEHDVAAKTAQDAAAALADLQQREQDLAAREDALIKSQTKLNVSAGAIADRDEQVKLREAACDRRLDAVAAREAAFESKVTSFKQALA